MPAARRTRSRPETGSWRPTDAELGAIVENRLDEAYMLSWPGPMEIWVPVYDTGGYDRARAPFGSYDFRFDQVKGTSTLRSSNQLRVTFYDPVLRPSPDLYVTFAYYSLQERNVINPLFKLPSEDIEKICERVPGKKDLWLFSASLSGLSRDRASKYQIALEELAGSCGWSVLPPKGLTLPFSLPTISDRPLETSAFFKRAFDAAILEAATGDQLLMAAQPDVFGRHRLIVSKSTGKWITVSIHGGTRSGDNNQMVVNIHRASFVPHPRHYLLIEHYLASQTEWYPWAYFINSVDFSRLAQPQGAWLRFTTVLNPQHVNRWTPSRVRISDIGRVVIAELQKSHRRKAA